VLGNVASPVMLERVAPLPLDPSLAGVARVLASIFRADFWHGWVASRVAAV
jgi:hypothetical protein